MASQYVWAGIAVGVFFGGLGIGYVIFSSLAQDGDFRTNEEIMQQLLMQSPEHRQQMLESLTQDPAQMRQWMANTQHIQEMSQVMRENHDFMMEMMSAIMDDPNLRVQMLGHMAENQEAMQQMRQMMNSGMMGPGMGQDTMMQNQQFMQQMQTMMQNPDMRQQMMQTMMQNQDFMRELMQNEEFMEQMMGQ